MSSRKQNSANVIWRCRGQRQRGFTLVEIALVLLVMVLSAGLVVTWAGRFQQRRNCDRYIQDLRVISAAFSSYYQQHNAWPPATATDVALPPDLAEALKKTNWHESSPFGGRYEWVAPDPAGAVGNGPGHGWGGRGAVILTAFSPSFPLTLEKTDLLYIDAQIDDGDLTTGEFRTGFNGWPVFLIGAAKR